VSLAEDVKLSACGHICGLHVIGVFNLFEHCISLEIPVFDSCLGLKRLHVFDPFFTCTLA
jgi:hypothetical protein